jgi:hypothetical protein
MSEGGLAEFSRSFAPKLGRHWLHMPSGCLKRRALPTVRVLHALMEPGPLRAFVHDITMPDRWLTCEAGPGGM